MTTPENSLGYFKRELQILADWLSEIIATYRARSNNNKLTMFHASWILKCYTADSATYVRLLARLRAMSDVLGLTKEELLPLYREVNLRIDLENFELSEFIVRQQFDPPRVAKKEERS